MQGRPNETLNGVPTAPTHRDNVNCGPPLMTLAESGARPRYYPCSMPPYPYSLQELGQLNFDGYQPLEGQHPCTG